MIDKMAQSTNEKVDGVARGGRKSERGAIE